MQLDMSLGSNCVLERIQGLTKDEMSVQAHVIIEQITSKKLFQVI